MCVIMYEKTNRIVSPFFLYKEQCEYTMGLNQLEDRQHLQLKLITVPREHSQAAPWSPVWLTPLIDGPRRDTSGSRCLTTSTQQFPIGETLSCSSYRPDAGSTQTSKEKTAYCAILFRHRYVMLKDKATGINWGRITRWRETQQARVKVNTFFFCIF